MRKNHAVLSDTKTCNLQAKWASHWDSAMQPPQLTPHMLFGERVRSEIKLENNKTVS